MEETRRLLFERRLRSLTDTCQSLSRVSQPRNSSRYVNSWPLTEYDPDRILQDETVRHIETTLARSLFNCDEL